MITFTTPFILRQVLRRQGASFVKDPTTFSIRCRRAIVEGCRPATCPVAPGACDCSHIAYIQCHGPRESILQTHQHRSHTQHPGRVPHFPSSRACVAAVPFHTVISSCRCPADSKVYEKRSMGKEDKRQRGGAGVGKG